MRISVAGSKGSNQWKRARRPSSRLMMVGRFRVSGGSAQPPALLKPHDQSRCRVSAAQSARVGANAFQLYQTLPSFSRSAYPPSRTLTPRLKKRSPHGVASHEAPASVLTDQRLDGAVAKSTQAQAMPVGCVVNIAADRSAALRSAA